jgi:hypothetical protein
MDAILEQFLQTNTEKLFPSMTATGEDEEEESFYAKKDGSAWAIPDFKMEKLLYSEMAGFESMDGIQYSIITRRTEFNKGLDTLHFE